MTVIYSIGQKSGFVASYILFTALLYYILTLTGKIGSWTYIHVAGLTLAIVIVGLIIRRLLK